MKTKQRRQEPSGPLEAATHAMLIQDAEPTEAFPASQNPASEAAIKKILMLVQLTLQKNFSAMQLEFKESLRDHDQRISHVEDNMGNLFTAYNEMVHSFREQAGEIQCLKNKVSDLEDRSRRNNLKFRGISKTVAPQDLHTYLMQIMKSLAPSLSQT